MKKLLRTRSAALAATFTTAMGLATGCATDGVDDASDQDTGDDHRLPSHRGTLEQRILRTPQGTREVTVEVADGFATFEDDIVVAEPHEANARGVGINAGGRWPGGVIPYVVDDPDMPEYDRITNAVNGWNAFTPVKFVPYTNQPYHVRIFNSDRCESKLGWTGAAEQGMWISTKETPDDIQAIGIAKSNDKVYYWYKNGYLTVGSSENATANEMHHKYTVAAGKSPANIVEISIAPSNDHVYTWYNDGTYSEGTSTDLDAYNAARPYIVETGRTINASTNGIAGIAIGLNGHTFTWYKDGSVSEGTGNDLGYYGGPTSYTLPGHVPANLVAIDIASTGNVYAWYTDQKASAGTSRANLGNFRAPYAYALPESCSGPGVIHEFGHTIGLEHEQNRHDRDSYVIVHEDNIAPGEEHNFKKAGANFTDLGTFDFASIMLYSSYNHAKDPTKPVMTKLDGSTFSRIGTISGGDVAAVDAMY